MNDLTDSTAGLANAIRIVEMPEHDLDRLGFQPVGTGRPRTTEAADRCTGAREAAHDVAS
jgi:hypothetical protein